MIEVHAPSQVRRWVRELPLLPLLILVPFVLAAVFADFIAPYDPTEPVQGAKIFVPPFWMGGGSTATLLGTDFQGRDSLSRLIFGARVSLIVGLMGTVVAGSLGTAFGILRGISAAGWIRPSCASRTPGSPCGAGLCHLPGNRRRSQHVEHRHHPRAVY